MAPFRHGRLPCRKARELTATADEQRTARGIEVRPGIASIHVALRALDDLRAIPPAVYDHSEQTTSWNGVHRDHVFAGARRRGPERVVPDLM